MTCFAQNNVEQLKNINLNSANSNRLKTESQNHDAVLKELFVHKEYECLTVYYVSAIYIFQNELYDILFNKSSFIQNLYKTLISKIYNIALQQSHIYIHVQCRFCTYLKYISYKFVCMLSTYLYTIFGIISILILRSSFGGKIVLNIMLFCLYTMTSCCSVYIQCHLSYRYLSKY